MRQRDDELITQDLKLHQRPFYVAMAWMKANGISGDVFDKAMWDPLMAIYMQKHCLANTNQRRRSKPAFPISAPL